MKYIILSIITISLCSCQKHDFDLADIKLPMKKETFTGKFKCDEGSDFVEAVTYKTTDEAALWFGDEKLSGNMVDGNSSFGTNQVRFQLVKKTNKIEAYQLQVETEKESLKLENHWIGNLVKQISIIKIKNSVSKSGNLIRILIFWRLIIPPFTMAKKPLLQI